MSRETPQAIVVGGGHNGLTCAFYLACAGLRTLVLERRDTLGGCAVTEEIDPERAPGCRVSTASYMASMLRPEVIRDLELGRHGLRMVAADPGLQIALEDGRVLTWWQDHARLKAELDAIDPADSRAFFALDAHLRELAAHLQPFFMAPPPDTRARGLAGLLELLRVGRRLRGLDGRQAAELLEFLTGSLDQLLQRYFRSEAVKRLVLANNLYGKHGGPMDPGSAMGLLFHLLSGGEEEKQGFSGHVIGGMGAITSAMASACREQGVDLRTGTPVRRVLVEGGRAAGVELEDGKVIRAPVVVSNADPKRTFLGLVGADHLPDEFLRAVRAIRMDGPAAKVNLVLSEEPRFTGMPAAAPPLQRMLMTLVPTLARAQANYNAAQEGRIDEDLWVDCVIPSLLDPGLVEPRRPGVSKSRRPGLDPGPFRSSEEVLKQVQDDGIAVQHDGFDAIPGPHVLTSFVQYLPGTPAGSDWDAERERLGDRVVAIIGRYAPNVPGTVVARDVLTPLDLERRFGITEGNIFHGDIRLDQLFFMRPLPGWAHYATPLPGLWLCGAGTHPGGGVTGAPGYNAARAVLSAKRR